MVDGTKCRDPLYRLGFLKKYLNGAGARIELSVEEGITVRKASSSCALESIS